MPHPPAIPNDSTAPLWPVAVARQLRRTPVMRYGMALVFTATALLVTTRLGYHDGTDVTGIGEQDPFVYFVVAVMFSSWFGGIGPGLLTTLLSTLIINFALLPPPFLFDLNSNDLPRLGVFLIVCLMVNWLEESRARTEARMQQSEEHFRSLVEGVQDHGIFMLDARGNILSWNASAQRITGFASQAAVGKHYSVLFPIEDAQLEKPTRLLDVAAEQGRVEAEDWCVRRDGSRYWAGIGITALRNALGMLRGFSVIMRDLTERKNAEELSRQRQNEIAHISRLTTMNELATGIAHEINQPLSAIAIYSHGCLERLKSVPGVPEDVLEAMRDIAAQAQRAGEVISHIRKLVRKREAERSSADINALVSQAVDLLHADAMTQRVELRVELAPDLSPVVCDSVQIEQVIINLVKNAIEAITGDNSELRVVTISTQQPDPTRVTVSVRDTGPGLSPADIDCAFEPFFTTKANGLGMGLNISHSIIESHGGRLTATTNPGRGVTFAFTVPISPASGKDADPTPPGPNDSALLAEAIVPRRGQQEIIELPALSTLTDAEGSSTVGLGDGVAETPARPPARSDAGAATDDAPSNPPPSSARTSHE